jgi:transmembrane sensor
LPHFAFGAWLGTEFLVTSHADQTSVVVFEGSVELRSTPTAEPMPIAAGSAVRLHVDGAAERLNESQTQQLAAWREGRLVFVGTPLREVVTELNRYRRGRVVLLNPALAHRALNGLFHTAAPERLLQAIEETTPARALAITPYLVLLR